MEYTKEDQEQRAAFVDWLENSLTARQFRELMQELNWTNYKWTMFTNCNTDFSLANLMILVKFTGRSAKFFIEEYNLGRTKIEQSLIEYLLKEDNVAA